jgi:uncharacterized protein VirK/YbjX
MPRARQLTQVATKQMHAMRPILIIIRTTNGLRAAVQAVFPLYGGIATHRQQYFGFARSRL